MPNKKNKGFKRQARMNKDINSPKSPSPVVRKQWSEQQMLGAINSVQKGHLSGNKAADLHGVPRSTLKDRLSGRVQHGTKPGPAPYLSKVEESELSAHLVHVANMGFGKTRRDVKCLVEQYAIQKNVLKGSAISNGWWQRFLERNPILRLRRGDSTAAIRMDVVNMENIKAYFEELKLIFDEFNFYEHPEAIYNMDETGVPLDPCPPKVIAAKGQKKVRYRTSGKKQQITVIDCGNATGQAMPPFIIFAAKQVNPLWTQDEVVGSRYAVSDNGWITQELFFYWLEKHFLQNAVAYRPILLLLDGHSSHFELKTIQLARQNNVIMFCLPPHTTHVCQPLDCSFFGPLKKSWQQECHHFYRKNPGKVISKLNFCRVFRNAWLSAITPNNISAGFRKSGIFPFNENSILTLESSKTPTTDVLSAPDTTLTAHTMPDTDTMGTEPRMPSPLPAMETYLDEEYEEGI